MRPIERFFIFGAIAASLIIALAGRQGGNPAFARAPIGAAPVKIGTVDLYAVAERMMAAPDLKKIREDIHAGYQAKADAIAKELKDMDSDLSVLPQNDPKVQELMRKAQTKQQEYQKIKQEQTVELERVNSTQIIEAFTKIRAAVDSVAARQEYTHVFSNRGRDRDIATTTLSQTLQELLARPIIKGEAADDLTKAVLVELKLEP